MVNSGRQQRGDTLVEVIFSIALISIVLVAAFNIIGASYRSAMLAKERIEAVSLAQQQAERLLLKRHNNLAADQATFAGMPINDGETLDSNGNIVSCGASGCIEGLYKVKTHLKPINDISQIDPSIMRTYVIQVEWQRVGSSDASDINDTSIELKIADRNVENIKRDCAVVESCN